MSTNHQGLISSLPPESVQRTMLELVYALIPATIAATWLFGWGVITNIVITSLAALLFEALFVALRGRSVITTLADGSALVTALLLAIAMPPLSPWWLLVLGAALAIILAKQLYGGLGNNLFNPAMVAYVILLISYPLEMTQWVAPGSLSDVRPGLIESLTLLFGSGATGVDGLTMATPLDQLRTAIALDTPISSALAASPIFGLLAGEGRDIIALLFLIGGLWLIYRRIIGWQVPLAMLATLTIAAGLFYLIDAERYAHPLFHLFSGGAMLGAFFIATDPVTGATSVRGRIVFGIGVGLLTYIIRTWGGYPDGVAFAVLLMNMAAPTIDYYTRPRTHGKER